MFMHGRHWQTWLNPLATLTPIPPIGKHLDAISDNRYLVCYRSRVSVCETQMIRVLLHLSENVVTIIQNFPQNLQRRSQSSCSCLLHATFDFWLWMICCCKISGRGSEQDAAALIGCVPLWVKVTLDCVFGHSGVEKNPDGTSGSLTETQCNSLIRVYLFSCISIFLSHSGAQLCSACCSFLTFLLHLGCKEMANIRDVINGFIFPEGWPAVLFSTSSFHCLCRCTSVKWPCTDAFNLLKRGNKGDLTLTLWTLFDPIAIFIPPLFWGARLQSFPASQSSDLCEMASQIALVRTLQLALRSPKRCSSVSVVTWMTINNWWVFW